ncbi:MAG: hypothetical protein AAF483_23990 [Planctomycetota bacterium]
MTAKPEAIDLCKVPWLKNIGQPNDSKYKIQSWDEWPGFESTGVESIRIEHQTWMDSFRLSDAGLPNELQELWQSTTKHVTDQAKEQVPFRENGDTWHAPNCAVYQAAWTAGLVLLFETKEITLPKPLVSQWDWFLTGHWPCAYQNVDEGQLIVY